MILLTGATGTIGEELVRLLAGSGRTVRALSRDPRPDAATDGIDWMRSDLADRASLPDAFEGGTCLFLLTGNTADMVRLQNNAIRAAARAGVPHVVKLSALGASDHSRSIVGLWHHNVERELRDSGLRWTILRPHSFMQNLLDPVVFDRDAGRVYSASGDGAIPLIDTRDIAAVAARILQEPDAHAAQTYTLTGGEALSFGALTKRVGRVLDRQLEYVSQSLDEAWARRRAMGQATWQVAAQLALAEYQRAGGPTAKTTDTIERITGRAPGTIEQFAADHADRLKGGTG